jgi:hypothetical protein
VRAFFRPTVAILLAALALAGLAVAARHPASGHWLPAVQGGDGGLQVRGERVVYRSDELRIEIELLDGPQRRIFLSSAGIPASDPFHEDTLGWRVFTFLLRLENSGATPIQIRPQSFYFITRRPVSQSSPCDFLCLRAAAEKAGLDRAAADRLVRAALDTSESIQPGERLSKLLIYTRLPDAFKDFVLDLDGMSVGGERLRLSVPYQPRIEDKKTRGEGKAP